MRDKIFGAFIGAGLLWTGRIFYITGSQIKISRKLRLQEMMYEDGVPDHEIDIVVNSQLSGPKIYVKDNGIICAKRSMAEEEKKYQHKQKINNN